MKREIKVLTLEERKIIESMLNRRCSVNSIAKHLQRTQSVIHYEVHRYGIPYDAEKAHSSSVKNRTKHKGVLVNMIYLQMEIDQMKMHIEILTEQIRSLKSERKS